METLLLIRKSVQRYSKTLNNLIIALGSIQQLKIYRDAIKSIQKICYRKLYKTAKIRKGYCKSDQFLSFAVSRWGKEEDYFLIETFETNN